MKREIYLHTKYPLTMLLRMVNKAIEQGDDEFMIDTRSSFGGEPEYFIKTLPKV